MTTTGRLRILHVDKFASRRQGGAPGYMLDMVAAQRNRGHDVEFFATDGETDLTSRFRDEFPPRVTLQPPPDSTRERIATVGTMVWSRRGAQAMARVLDEFRPDIVHCHNIYHQLSPSILRPVAKRGIPAVMTVHDFKLACPTYHLIDGNGDHCTACVTGPMREVVRRRCQGGSLAQSTVLMAESWAHRTFHAYAPIRTFLCPSRYMAEIIGAAGYADRVRHLPNGQDFSTIRPRDGAGHGVLFGGRLTPEKGVDHLIRAMALLPGEPLTVCGSGTEQPRLEALARAELGDRVRFLGHVSRAELLDHIAAAAVVAVPSVWAENQPLMALDAMASGVPIVTGDSPALQELAQPGVSGLTVDPRDHRALANALAHFLHDPERRTAIGRTARAFVLERNDLDHHLDELERIYQPLVTTAEGAR